MFGILLLSLFVTGAALIAARVDNYEPVVAAFVFGSIALVVSVFLAYPVIGTTGGLMPDYSEGTRDGYVTKFSRSGIIFKTWEGQLQVGTGNMAALQEPFHYSIPDTTLHEIIDNAARTGSRVRLTYRQYLMPNFREGESSYIITRVDVLPDTQE